MYVMVVSTPKIVQNGFPENWKFLVQRWIDLKEKSQLTSINNICYLTAANQMNSTALSNVSGSFLDIFGDFHIACIVS